MGSHAYKLTMSLSIFFPHSNSFSMKGAVHLFTFQCTLLLFLWNGNSLQTSNQSKDHSLSLRNFLWNFPFLWTVKSFWIKVIQIYPVCFCIYEKESHILSTLQLVTEVDVLNPIHLWGVNLSWSGIALASFNKLMSSKCKAK